MNTNLRAALFILMVCLSAIAQEDQLCVGHYWTPDQANLKMKEFASQWSDLKSWEERAATIKEGIKSGMQWEKMPEITGNFNPVIHSKREMDGYIVENIAIESFPGFYITGNLYRPSTGDGKFAAILSPHGHLPDKRLREDVQTRAAVFARMGSVVFAYDMLGFSESKQVEHTIPIALALQTYNSKRVLDYLLSRDDVDVNRIGMTGGSGGATQTFMLAALDNRIKVVAPVVQVSAHFFGGCVCESGMPVHKGENHQTNNVEIAALAAPRPLLLVSNGADWTRNTPIIEYPYIQKVYALYDAEHKVENVHLPSEKHDYGYSKRTAVYNFFGNHLQLNLGAIPYENGYREDFVTLLGKEDLKVFNNEHPMPGNALKGNLKIMKFLEFD
ncbi:alpha/beta hydrolase family protein [Ulvibacterium marinum]|uniref:alpha/beta hydrolase family protein n=1 Tax=Ulvibacterium marinum TaxID=2419782 RepID=UPI002494E5B0|nr:CocE/NonD family hydrolase [Ulvibacterium marinum]